MITNDKEFDEACRNDPRFASMFDIVDVVQSGNGGMLSSGELVDRRKHPEARPIVENDMLNVPELNAEGAQT